MNEKIYEQAVRNYLDDVYRLALSMTRNEADAADVAQIVFIRLDKCRKSFESESHLKNWLLKVTANESRSLLRSFWKRNVSTDLSQANEPSSPGQEEKPEAFEKIEAILARLSKAERMLVHLYYYEQMDQKSIARLMRISQSAVSSRLYRIKRRMKEMWMEEEQ